MVALFFGGGGHASALDNQSLAYRFLPYFWAEFLRGVGDRGGVGRVIYMYLEQAADDGEDYYCEDGEDDAVG